MSRGRLLFTMLCCALLLAQGCRRSRDHRDPRTLDDMRVTVELRLNTQQPETKAEEPADPREGKINDLNIFFVHQNVAGEVRHYYLDKLALIDPNTKIDIHNVRLGQYRLYAVANVGYKLGTCSHSAVNDPTDFDAPQCTMSQAEIEALSVTHTSVNGSSLLDKMIMSSKSNVFDIKTFRQAVEITLLRRVSKIIIEYKVEDKVVAQNKLKLNTIQLQNTPSTLNLFDSNNPTSGMTNLPSMAIDGGTNSGHAEFYVFENHKGLSSFEIPSQEFRSSKTAPANATRVYFDAEYFTPSPNEMRKINYAIYAGDPADLRDFNVNGNNVYPYKMVIEGINLDDPRVSQFYITATPHFGSASANKTLIGKLNLVCNNYYNDKFVLSCSEEGNRGTFKVYDDKDNPITESYYGFTILTTDSNSPNKIEKTYSIHYTTSNIVPPSSAERNITFTVTDVNQNKRPFTCKYTALP